MRLTIPTLLLVGVATATYLLWPRSGAVVSASLGYPKPLQWIFGSGYRDTAFQLSAREEAALLKCRELLQQYRQRTHGDQIFLAETVRTSLEKILRDQPDFFYAEYLLGLWYRCQGDDMQASEHHARSLALAPVVLIQPYRDEEGQPLRGVVINDFVVACCRVRQGSLDYVDLEFVELTTDGAGELEIPVFDAVYLRSRISLPDGYKMIYPPLGFFRSASRRAALPASVAKECPPLETGESAVEG